MNPRIIQPVRAAARAVRAHPKRVLLALFVMFLVLFECAAVVLVRVSPPGHPDVIFVLSGDAAGLRFMKGLDTVKTTGARRLVVFVESAGGPFDVSDKVGSYAASHGVDPATVRVAGPVGSTTDEAGRAAALVRACGWKHVDVVTSPYHSRRAHWLFARALGSGIDVRMVVTDEPFRRWLWWANATDSEHVVLEWIKGIRSLQYIFTRPSAIPSGVSC